MGLSEVFPSELDFDWLSGGRAALACICRRLPTRIVFMLSASMSSRRMQSNLCRRKSLRPLVPT
eukprot:scaffold648407_cov45-Prasinocladus_malaysianus.AAC.1